MTGREYVPVTLNIPADMYLTMKKAAEQRHSTNVQKMVFLMVEDYLHRYAPWSKKPNTPSKQHTERQKGGGY